MGGSVCGIMEHFGRTASPVLGAQSPDTPTMDDSLPTLVRRRSKLSLFSHSLLADSTEDQPVLPTTNPSKNSAWSPVVLIFCMVAGCLATWFTTYRLVSPVSLRSPVLPVDIVPDAVVGVAEAGGV